jgi:carbonic anhydrase
MIGAMSTPQHTDDPTSRPIGRPISRRTLVAAVGLAGVGGAIAGSRLWPRGGDTVDHHGFSLTTPRTAEEAMTRLRAGNQCYIEEHFEIGNQGRTASRRTEIAPAQHPYAIVLACADSRVAPEVIFSAGLGDLFVVRVAGNIVDPRCLGVLGSIEYAIEELKIPLVFVLGHEACGAVKAAIQVVQNKLSPPGAISVLTDAIRPVVESASGESGDLLRNAVVGNVERQIENLVHSTDIVAPALASNRLQIAGGVYELNTGRVRVLPPPKNLAADDADPRG